MPLSCCSHPKPRGRILLLLSFCELTIPSKICLEPYCFQPNNTACQAFVFSPDYCKGLRAFLTTAAGDSFWHKLRLLSLEALDGLQSHLESACQPPPQSPVHSYHTQPPKPPFLSPPDPAALATLVPIWLRGDENQELLKLFHQFSLNASLPTTPAPAPRVFTYCRSTRCHPIQNSDLCFPPSTSRISPWFSPPLLFSKTLKINLCGTIQSLTYSRLLQTFLTESWLASSSSLQSKRKITMCKDNYSHSCFQWCTWMSICWKYVVMWIFQRV